tara:strand:+ start:101 stop:382 length:282 start_codon:yes stop_codon:yes gene_type:complete
MISTDEMKNVKGAISDMSMDDIIEVTEMIKMRRTMLGNKLLRTLVVGDKVSFEGRGGIPVFGKVTKVMVKNIVVDTGEPRKWRVPATLLTKVA